jgi:hypothetical protein
MQVINIAFRSQKGNTCCQKNILPNERQSTAIMILLNLMHHQYLGFQALIIMEKNLIETSIMA